MGLSTVLRRRITHLKPIITKQKGIEEYEITVAEEEPLSPSARLLQQPDLNLHIVVIIGSKTRISPQILKDKLSQTLLKHPRFTSLLVADENNGELKWVQIKVDLDQHIIIPKVDESMLKAPDKFVEDYIYNLSNTGLDKSKPLWDIHFINIKTRDAEAVALLRVNHSLGDGASLVSLLLACTRQIADESMLPTIPTKKRRPIDSGYSTKQRCGLWRYLAAIWLFIRMICYTFVDISMFVATITFLKDTKTPISSIMSDSKSKAIRIVHRTINLDDLKLVKNAMDMTINDVALGITQAGLSKYLNKRYVVNGEDKGATERSNNLPRGIRLRTCLAVNLRPSAGIQDLADMMEKSATGRWSWGNCLGFIFFPFKIALRDDPLDYVKEAKATIDRKKCSFESLYTSIMIDLVLKIFGIKAAAVVARRAFSNITACFANLIGPQEEIEFCGHPIAYIAPGCYGQPYGLLINFQSYTNKMTMVLSFDESVIPDPQQLLDDIEESLHLIKEAVVERVLDKNKE